VTPLQTSSSARVKRLSIFVIMVNNAVDSRY
jgi:hypothetical protein